MRTMTMTGTVQLVCEGGCNPGCHQLDDHIDAFRRLHQPRHHGGLEPLPERLFTELKRLRHTLHSPRGGDLATCLTCGHTRRWGN